MSNLQINCHSKLDKHNKDNQWQLSNAPVEYTDWENLIQSNPTIAGYMIFPKKIPGPKTFRGDEQLQN